MADEQQSQGILNNSFVLLFLLFTIPASLTLAGVFYMSQQQRIPGGADSFCVRDISDNTQVRLDIYAYTAGLVQFETQSFSVSDDAGENWLELFEDTIPVPLELNCDNGIRYLDDDNIILQTQKTIAWSADRGNTWQTHNVCDSPRPDEGRCDAETLTFAEIDLQADGSGRLMVQQSEVDEFEEPQRDENNNPIVVAEWELITEDAGENWVLANIND